MRLGRGSIAVFAGVLIACSDPRPEILLEVSADTAVIGRVDRVRIDVTSAEATAELEQDVDGKAPNCLPFSVSILAESVDTGDEVTFEVGAFDGEQLAFTKVVRASIVDGLQRALVHFEGACLADGCAEEALGDLLTISRDDAERLPGGECAPGPPDARTCLEQGGCYDEDGVSCLLPCPDPEEAESVMPPQIPEPPVPPRFDVCPPGWNTVEAHCEPWPIDGFIACATDEVRTPGRGCVRLGEPCVGGRPPNLPGDAIVVAAGDDFDAALARARDGQTIALERGTFASAERTWVRSVRIVGCGAETIIDTRSVAVRADVTVESLTVRADLTIEASETMTAAGVRFEGTLDVAGTVNADLVDLRAGANVSGTFTASAAAAGGTIVSSGTLVLDDFVVRDFAGPGVDVSGGAATARRGIVEAVEDKGIRTQNGATLDAAWLVVRDVAGGEGLHAAGAGTVLFANTWIQRTARHAIHLDGAGPSTVRDIGVRDIDRLSDRYGEALRVVDGALIVERFAAEDVWRTGLAAIRADVTASHFSVSDVKDDGERGRGMDLAESSLVGDHLRVEDAAYGGIRIRNTATATITHLFVVRTDSQSGVRVDAGGRLVLERACIEDVDGTGLYVGGAPRERADVRATDVNVKTPGAAGVRVGTRTEETHAQAYVSLTRVRVSDSPLFGVIAREAGVDLSHVNVRGTRNAGRVELGGVGIYADSRSVFRGSHVHAEDNDEAGLLVAGADVELSHFVVKATLCDVMARRCGFGGSGVFVNLGRLSLEHFLLDSNATYGLQSRSEAPIDLVHGIVRGHPVGLFLNELASDLPRYLRRVRIVDNDVDLLVE